MTYEYGDELRAIVAAHMEAFTRQSSDGSGLHHAAVAVSLVGGPDGDACYLLTRRAAGLRSHAGQWALPGGRVEAGEVAEEAARRELHEEVGLELSADSVLGTLDDYATRSGYLITPVVVWAGPSTALTPDPNEVESVHLVPLADLDQPGVPRFITIPESDRPVIQLPVGDRFIHAPTAAVLYQLREVALHGRHTRVSHFEQPVFAWK